MQAFSARTTAGVTRQELVSTWDQWNRTKDAEGSRVLTEAPPVVNIANSSVYQVDDAPPRGLNWAFEAILQGTVGASRSDPGDNSEPLTTEFAGPDGQDGAAFVQAFWNASNTTQTMNAIAQQIADSYTTFMRTTMSSESDSRYAPTVFTDQMFARVRWEWLTFPLGLLVSAHVFLLASIWQTRRLCVQPWKGHRVPVLLASIDDIVKELVAGGLNSRTGLEDRVGRMKVRLEYDDKDEKAFKQVL